MSRERLARILSDSDLHEMLKYSKELILKIDETIVGTPLPIESYDIYIRKVLSMLASESK